MAANVPSSLVAGECERRRQRRRGPDGPARPAASRALPVMSRAMAPARSRRSPRPCWRDLMTDSRRTKTARLRPTWRPRQSRTPPRYRWRSCRRRHSGARVCHSSRGWWSLRSFRRRRGRSGQRISLTAGFRLRRCVVRGVRGVNSVPSGTLLTSSTVCSSGVAADATPAADCRSPRPAARPGPPRNGRVQVHHGCGLPRNGLCTAPLARIQLVARFLFRIARGVLSVDVGAYSTPAFVGRGGDGA